MTSEKQKKPGQGSGNTDSGSGDRVRFGREYWQGLASTARPRLKMRDSSSVGDSILSIEDIKKITEPGSAFEDILGPDADEDD